MEVCRAVSTRFIFHISSFQTVLLHEIIFFISGNFVTSTEAVPIQFLGRFLKFYNRVQIYKDFVAIIDPCVKYFRVHVITSLNDFVICTVIFF